MLNFLKGNFFVLFTGLIIMLGSFSAEAQLSRRQIKKNSKRMTGFKGKKNTFAKSRQYNYVGISLNGLNYLGDLSPNSSRYSTDFKLTKPGVGLSFGHRFGPFYTLQGSFMYGTLVGDDFISADPYQQDSRFRYVRNLSFRNHIKELSVTAVFDLYQNKNTYISRVSWTPYGFVGLSGFHHNPQGKVNQQSSLPEAGQWVNLKPLGTEGQYSDLPADAVNYGLKPYSNFQISVPFGIGIRYRINDVMDFNLETGTRYIFTDYIDDVSGNYVDLLYLNSDLAREMSDRSTELNAAVSGEPRNIEARDATSGPIIAGNGGYDSYGGYGREFLYNYRGKSNNKDIYFVTTLRVTYILGGSYKKAKFR
ncbi:MAG: DUF6089 family protein [Cyclobacteriaceae bacterium]|nr:DUF6089 family protein [Cyclobacteriaceae bacterium]